MMCDACTGHVERALRALEGVAEARADLTTHTATITRDPAKATDALVKAAIEEEG
jgi:copper chaperone CopZ